MIVKEKGGHVAAFFKSKNKMADAKDIFNKVLDGAGRIGDIYSKVRLADKGIATPPTVVLETNGFNDPLVMSGSKAAVVANDPLADAINNGVNKAAMAYSAKQFSDSMPYVVGGLAFAVAIYLLVRNK